MSATPKTPQKLLLDSARAGDLAGIDQALELGVNINFTHNNYAPVIHVAIQHDHAAAVEHLLKRGASPDLIRFENRFSPLQTAISYGNIKAMKILIKHGVHMDPLDEFYQELSETAAYARHNPDAVWDVLMDPATGLDTQQLSPATRGPKFVFIATSSILNNKSEPTDPQALAALIRRGVAYDTLSEGGNTALHMLMHGAIYQSTKTFSEDKKARAVAAVKYALAAGASPYIKNKNGITAIDYAQEFPEFKQAFYEGMHMDETVAAFNPQTDKLVVGGKPTELVMYCCYEGHLSKLLDAGRWQDPKKFIIAKHELGEALIPHYQEKYSADLDCSSARRTATDGALVRFTRSSTKNRIG